MKRSGFIILSLIVGGITGAVITNKFEKQKQENITPSDKFKGYYNMLNQWLNLKQKGISLEEYFLNRGYKNIAIYGIGEIGKRLYYELKESNICIQYGVDKNVKTTIDGLKIVKYEENFEEVDVMVVTATFDFEEIEEEIQKKFFAPILSLDDIIYDLYIENS